MKKLLMNLFVFFTPVFVLGQDGTLDLTFDVDGRVSTDIISSNSDKGQKVLVQPDGKIIVAGWDNQGTSDEFYLVRLNNSVFPMGIEDEVDATVYVYPNPTNSQLTLSFSAPLKNGKLTLVDRTGKIVHQQNQLTGNKITLDVSNHAAGIYFVSMQDETRTWTGKFVKE